MNEITIIYYSSNREKSEFEERIRDNILNVCGDLPIISGQRGRANIAVIRAAIESARSGTTVTVSHA